MFSSRPAVENPSGIQSFCNSKVIELAFWGGTAVGFAADLNCRLFRFPNSTLATNGKYCR